MANFGAKRVGQNPVKNALFPKRPSKLWNGPRCHFSPIWHRLAWQQSQKAGQNGAPHEIHFDADKINHSEAGVVSVPPDLRASLHKEKIRPGVCLGSAKPPPPPLWIHLVNGTGNSPSPGQPTPGAVKQDKSSGGSVDTTKTRSGPQRVRMSSGERPIGAAKGKQADTEALCQTPPPVHLVSANPSPSPSSASSAPSPPPPPPKRLVSANPPTPLAPSPLKCANPPPPPRPLCAFLAHLRNMPMCFQPPSLLSLRVYNMLTMSTISRQRLLGADSAYTLQTAMPLCIGKRR